MTDPRHRPSIDQVNDPQGQPVLHLSGDFDLATAGQLADALDRVTARHPQRIVIDLADTTLMDCAGVRPIVHLLNRPGGPGSTVTLSDPIPIVRRVLEVNGLGGACIVDRTDRAGNGTAG